jgi:hypothetical protein
MLAQLDLERCFSLSGKLTQLVVLGMWLPFNAGVLLPRRYDSERRRAAVAARTPRVATGSVRG